jgi:hypothetical protein
LQRRRLAGAALVDEHDVAPVVEPAEQRERLRTDVDRALARSACEQEHRVGQLAPCHRRHNDVVHGYLRAVGPGRIECALHDAALHAVADARHAAFGQVLLPMRGQRGQRQPCCDPALLHSPNRRLSSPLSISFFRSSAPPTSEPLTNTIGSVGQPVHIFSAPALAPLAQVAAVAEILEREPAAVRTRRAWRQNGLPIMPTTSTGFDAAADCTL